MAPFVAREDLLTCLRVCRQWNCYFTPALWRNFTVPQDWSHSPSFPTLATLQKNAHYVRNLTIKATEGLAPFLQRCNGLKVLVIFGDQIGKSSNPCSDIWDDLTNLIRNNPNIEWIVFGFSLSSGPSTSFLQALPKACPNLKRYESSQGKYQSRAQVEALMHAIRNLKAVSFRYENFVNINMSKSWTMPHLSELTLRDARGLSIESQVDFLQLDGCGLPDPDDIGKMLNSLSRLEFLTLCGSSISKTTFSSLKRHFRTLTSLEIKYCTQVESYMTQQILEECPNLIRLLSSVLMMEDVFLGKTWAAVNLKHLEVNFVQTIIMGSKDLKEEQRAMFKQLSRLTQLQTLVTGSQGRRRKLGLQFQIELGLDQLKTLTKLKTLNFGVPLQQMSDADVVWIASHLESLTRVEGQFHTDQRMHLQLTNRLREFGLDVPEMDDCEFELVYDDNNDTDSEESDNYDEDESEEYEPGYNFVGGGDGSEEAPGNQKY
ncbi:hypothetical protein BGZ80_006397 [Entomortierella chlamydospora]|uniref:F-box domain-containing protein n=1 Tax=Entomortierella chlamydospora TaxID=101097 RepID=A0A9P6MYW2_9FUNG|nr:hypothetical protein BGZ80_006397 [Entomortierella chlamydospora]